jgi:2-aminoethylphosphonate-pyruvate transaminase
MTPRLAVILAAGRGVRLGPLGREMPKGFLEIGGHTLIERSLSLLRDAGIERAVIVTGHLADHYAALAARLGPWVTLVHNAEYATSGSAVSLAAAGAIDEPYLLVESDLLYEPRAPRLLVDSSDGDVVLASGTTHSGDEVYVGAKDGRLVDLSKQLDRLAAPRVGELVGLTRVSPALHAEILRQASRLLADTRQVEYETTLVAAARHHPVSVLVVDDLVWTEVDDTNHLSRAVSTIVPRLGA